MLVEFEPKEIHYETLVRQFFRMHDPTQLNRQGPDVGDQYRSAIFIMDDTQTAIAENVHDELEESLKQSIATVIQRASEFYTAETLPSEIRRTHRPRHVPHPLRSALVEIRSHRCYNMLKETDARG